MSIAQFVRLLAAGAALAACLGAAPHLTHAAATSGTPTASAGCGRAWTSGSDVDGALTYGGVQRTYLLHIPKGYNGTTPMPLVLNLHGTGMNGALEALLTHMSATADAQGFVVAYPNGTAGANGMSGWDVYSPGAYGYSTNAWHNTDDVGFLTTLVGSLEGQLCLDTSRIDVTGYSLGASMAYHLACSDVSWLAAIAPVAGAMTTWQMGCTLAHPTPLLAFNGKLDSLVPYNGIYFELPIPLAVSQWAQAVGCPSSGQTGFQQGDVVESVYGPCSSGADTELYTITDGGHTWPGGYPLPGTTQTIDASALMGAFFAAHPLH